MRLILFITVFLFLLSPTSRAVEDLDANNIGEAAGMVLLEARMVEMTRVYCVAQLPDDSRMIDFYSYSWEMDNQKELDAMQAYMGKIDQAKMKASQAPQLAAYQKLLKTTVAARGARHMCGGIMGELKAGSRKISKRTPRASRFLLAYLANNPLAPLTIEAKNYRTGCLKRAINEGVGLTAGRKKCTCLFNVTYSELSVSEIAGMKKLVAQGKSLDDYAPMRRIQPQLAACVVKVKK